MSRSLRIARKPSTLLAWLLFGLLLLALAGAPAALAGPTVTVRVEGVNQTLLGPTEVTTDSTTRVIKDSNPEHSCSGASAAGALQLATAGSWGGEWFNGLGYSVETILGETHAFEPGAPANYFWSYWLDNKASTAGICEGELRAGESILFFPECFSETSACPAAPNPLGISAPAVAERAAPISVSVTSYNNASGAASPAVGAAVTGGGAGAMTDAGGHATLAIPQTGKIQLQVIAPGSVRTETTVCVHAGDDGSCGTRVAGGSNTSPPTNLSSQPAGVVLAQILGVTNGRVYPRRFAPRVLRGIVKIGPGATLRQVRIRLHRRVGHRCFNFSGSRARFVRAARCAPAAFFSVGSAESFSYLLPARLPRGRYAYDIQAVDGSGRVTALVGGVSHVVFRVK
jgi:hypothetical protein